MALVLIILLAGLGAGFAARGSLRNFERLQIHWWGVAIVGLGLQAIPVPVRFGAGVGRRAAGGFLRAAGGVRVGEPALAGARLLILIGLALNLMVITANRGMPVSEQAIRVAGTTGESSLTGIEGTKHHLMTSDDVLTPLADVIPIPPPFGVIISVGDVFLYVGVASFVVLVMLGRFDENRRPPARYLQGYRGKHLSPERRLPRRTQARLAASPTAAVRSGNAR